MFARSKEQRAKSGEYFCDSLRILREKQNMSPVVFSSKIVTLICIIQIIFIIWHSEPDNKAISTF